MNKIKGHLAALVSIVIWGTTFISTKILLVDFYPVEILITRFIIAYSTLWVISPKLLKGVKKREEITFALAGLTGICLYYLLENIALTYTLASNVGVIISVAPFFTALLTTFFFKGDEKPKIPFYIGFLVSIIGIALISFTGNGVEVNFIGDFLALIAAIIWALYSILIKKISRYKYPLILTTRRVFFYGILFMLPTLIFFDTKLDFNRYKEIKNLLNILYLGVGASALCFLSWNYAVKELGAVNSSIYIYMVPVITVLTSVLILDEKLTLITGLGIVLTLIGQFISEIKDKKINTKIKELNNNS